MTQAARTYRDVGTNSVRRRKRVLRNARRLLTALGYEEAAAMSNVEVEAACIILNTSLTLLFEAASRRE